MSQAASPFSVTASDGCRIAGIRVGAALDPAIVLAHPIAFDGGFWGAVAELLSGDHSLIVPDARGHGGSNRGGGETTVERMAQDVVDVMDALGVERAGFAGCSMGSAVGMHLGAIYGDRFDWVVLANAPARIPLPREFFENAIQAARAGGYADLARGMLGRWTAPDAAARRSCWYARMEAMMLATDPGGFADAFAALRDSDRHGDLPAIRVRTRVVTGEYDGAFNPDAARELAGCIPGAEAVVVPGAGHLAPAEAPDAFAAILREMVRLPA